MMDHFVDRNNIDPALAGVPLNEGSNTQIISHKPSILENLSPFVLIIGLGVHSLFEGIAVGLSPDFQKATFICLAIVMHKGAAAMALGIAN
jgi:zinc transporter 1/2/3